MLDQYPEGLVAVVSDSYNVFEACTNLWGKELKDKIKNRKGTLVVRPDSGDPPVIVPQLLDLLGEAFKEDVTKTSTGHKLLPPYIRMIQGDGISVESLGDILNAMADKGWAADNLAFGSGGALLQKINRDTQKCAFKCSEITKRGRLVHARVQGPDHGQGEAVEEGRCRWRWARMASSPLSPRARARPRRIFSSRSSGTAPCASSGASRRCGSARRSTAWMRTR